MTVSNFGRRYYSKQGLWSLFLMCAFPLHLWTILLALRDFSWLIDRSNLWDAISVLAYGLIFAFAESLIIFCIAAVLGLLVSTYWRPERRVALMSILALCLAVWAILSQLYWLLGVSTPEFLVHSLMDVAHPVRFLYGGALAVILLTAVLPAYFILKSDVFFRTVKGLIDRISVLMTVYLFFDFVGLILVIIRNVNGR